MLFENVTGPMQVILIVVTSLLGIFGVSSALEGYLLTNMNPIQRVLSAAGGLLLIDPNSFTDVIGIALIAVIVIWQILQKRQERKVLNT